MSSSAEINGLSLENVNRATHDLSLGFPVSKQSTTRASGSTRNNNSTQFIY